MPEPKPPYSVTMDVEVVSDVWEINLLRKARQIRRDWLKHKRRVFLMIDVDGHMYSFMGEPCGRIEIS